MDNKVEKQEKFESNSKQNNVRKSDVKKENSTVMEKQEKKTEVQKENKNATTKKIAKSKTKKTEQKQETTENSTTPVVEDKTDNCYALLRTFYDTLTDKKGNPKEYLVGEFADMNDKIHNIVIRPENANELLECDLGTFVRIDLKELGERKFAMSLEFIDKRLKNIAA